MWYEYVWKCLVCTFYCDVIWGKHRVKPSRLFFPSLKQTHMLIFWWLKSDWCQTGVAMVLKTKPPTGAIPGFRYMNILIFVKKNNIICSQIYVCIHVQVCVYIYIYIFVTIQIYVYIRIYIQTNRSIHVFTRDRYCGPIWNPIFGKFP